MGDPFRETYRLEQFDLGFDGLESHSVSAKIQDFVEYYFSRFITNIKHSFKDFSQSELLITNKRYQRQIDLTLNDPLLRIQDLRVSIPKGMLLSYYQTLEKLILCLTNIKADRLILDLNKLSDSLQHDANHVDDLAFYTKTMFESDKKIIGSLYSTIGLSYTLGKNALVSLTETQQVNNMLLSVTRDYYPKVIEMSSVIDALERNDRLGSSSTPPSQLVRHSLMGMAYRVSMFAVVMDHIQNMEHAFVTALNTLKEQSNKHRT